MKATSVTTEQLASRLGREKVQGDLIFAESEKDVVQAIQWAKETGITLFPEGRGAFRTETGEVPGIRLSLERMTGVVEHSAGDLTITVQPGVTLERLQGMLQPHGQMLPLDPPWQGVTTVGGAVALARTGPKRLKNGQVRDAVLGLRVALASGKVIRTGGKVVKNVAGYDMNKLFVGSMGTLGAITECTLKLRPVPADQAVAGVAGKSWGELAAFARRLLDSPLEPSAVELVNGRVWEELFGTDTSPCGLVVGFDDEVPAVQSQLDRLHIWGKEAGLHLEEERRGDEAAGIWNRLGRLTPHHLRPAMGRFTLKLKGITLPTQTATLLERGELSARKQELRLFQWGGLGTGISHLVLQGHREQSEQAVEWVHALRRTVEEMQGYVVVEHASDGLSSRIDLWGRKPGGFSLMKNIKSALDPEGIFPPGRFGGM
jgi:glycolate oxidase FAD binding subunit